MRRRTLLAAPVAAALTAVPYGARGQAAKVVRLGFLGAASAAGYESRVEALRAGLREVGWAEGRNLEIEFRWAEGHNDRLPELAMELVRLNVDILVAHATEVVRAAQQATSTIPIVMISADAVATGLIASLARPRGNVTGVTFLGPELMAKRLELLKQLVPAMGSVTVLLHAQNPTINALVASAVQTTAKSLNLRVYAVAVDRADELGRAFAEMAEQRMGGVVVQEAPIFIDNTTRLVELAAHHRLPSIGFAEYARAGGLIGYGVDFIAMYHLAAGFVDRILKGASPADLPVQQPTKFLLALNLTAARALAIDPPPLLLARADEVIE